MGMDIEIVVYRGKPLPVAEIAALIERFTPYAERFRHSLASELKAPVAPDLHCIAFYDHVAGDEDDDQDDDVDDDADGDEHSDPGAIAEPDCPGLVREISRTCGEAFLIGYGDHSCTGTYAHFRNGELVSPNSLDDICAEHDDYAAWPAQQLSSALGKQVEIDELAQLYFPHADKPPLYKIDEPKRAIAFDPDRYAMGLSESM